MDRKPRHGFARQAAIEEKQRRVYADIRQDGGPYPFFATPGYSLVPPSAQTQVPREKKLKSWLRQQDVVNWLDNMSHLSVFGAEFSVVRQKAIEDAKKRQLSINEDFAKKGEEPPPYALQELIGKGSFGRVYKARDTKTGQMVAVKMIDIEESDTLGPKEADTYSEILKEINALKLLSESGARNINCVIDALPVGQSMWMVTEYCAGGSVATLMKPTAPGGLQEKWIIPILREAAEAIFWVHKQGIIHRDIKCANVLVTEVGGVQLCDFGVAGVIETKLDKRSTFIGTLHWMAPELFDPSAAYGTEIDIWAFGSLVYEIASGLPPNVAATARIGNNPAQFGNYLKQHTPRLEGDQYSEPLKDLVAFCLEDDPARRPTIEQVQRHPYIFNTSSNYPSASLAMLVKAFKLWESQGGNRKSLFAGGGAQNLSDFASTAMADDDWNFSTTKDFDRRVSTADAQAVYDVYGSNVDFDADFAEQISRTPKKGRRRPPPQLPVMKAPLEKVFDPNTISNYEDNARAYYGYPPPPPTSDLPLRDNSQHNSLRESLIDLDASFNGNDLSKYVDMETIKAGPRVSVDYNFDDDSDLNKPPLSDPAEPSNNRRTQDWKFPAMQPPASANPELTRFPFNEEERSSTATPGSARPGLFHHPTEPIGLPTQGYDLPVPRPQDNRISVGSLIDLDESLPEPIPDYPRPSTANSDAISVSGSDVGLANPFDLERHASLYNPLTSGREPSIYVSDASDYVHDENGRPGSRAIAHPEEPSNMYSSDFSDSEFAGGPGPELRSETQPRYTPAPQGQYLPQLPPLPPVPAPPSERVMQGLGNTDEVKAELSRLLGSFSEHLSHANTHVANLPVRRGGGAARPESLNGE